MKVHIEKDIYIPSGIYCTQCSKKRQIPKETRIAMNLETGFMHRMMAPAEL